MMTITNNGIYDADGSTDMVPALMGFISDPIVGIEPEDADSAHRILLAHGG